MNLWLDAVFHFTILTIFSSGTDKVRAKREPSLCNESAVNGHFWSNLCLNCIFKIFISFLTRFPFCSIRIYKVGKCAAFQLWTPVFLTLRFDDFFPLVEKLAFFKKWGYRMFLKAWHKSRWHNHLITIAHFASHSPLDFPFLSSYRVAPASGRIDKDPILLETQRAEKTMGKDNEIIQWLQNNRS